MTEKVAVAVAEMSAIHCISTQLCQRTHSARLPVIFPGQIFSSYHHVVERCVSLYWDFNVVRLIHVRSDPQGVRYRYFFRSETTISVFVTFLRVRGGRNCQNDEEKEKKPHAGIYARLSQFGELWTTTGKETVGTLNMRVYVPCNLSVHT